MSIDKNEELDLLGIELRCDVRFGSDSCFYKRFVGECPGVDKSPAFCQSSKEDKDKYKIPPFC